MSRISPSPAASRLCVALVALLALAACTDRREWRTAQVADTLEAYEAYLAANPAGEYAPLAQRRLQELKEQRDWRIATEIDTADAYRSFIDAHPKGRWVREARIRIQNFLLDPMPPAVEDIRPPEAAAPAGVAGDGAPSGLPPAAPSSAPIDPAVAPSAADEPLFDAPATTPPKAAPAAPASPAAPSKPATPAAAPLSVSGLPQPVSHRIQLGAFSTREQAQAEWAQARARHRELLGLVPTVTPVGAADGRSMFRLQASVASESQAREICRVLSTAQQPCVYAPPAR
jgi:cell division septation protein DedD